MARSGVAERPSPRTVRREVLRADRRLGQHFLLDPNLLGRIARLAGDLGGRTVIEVGPGPGGLTRALLDAGAGCVIAIERDARFLPALHQLAVTAGGRLRLVEADALTLRLAGLSPGRVSVVANLPYNIATSLLLNWLGELERIDRMTLMFQREVALRIAAPPGSRVYGRLSVLTQWLCDVRPLLQLPARAFVPPPRVDSSLLQLVPRPAPLAPAGRAALERVLQAAFGQRRKMLRSSLRSLDHDAEALLAAADLPPTARAEEIDVEGFCRLARSHAARSSALPGASPEKLACRGSQ
jgi:16S rRNA (adenine1518-N6/adenine1519-N6)-dimethyltransferase